MGFLEYLGFGVKMLAVSNMIGTPSYVSHRLCGCYPVWYVLSPSAEPTCKRLSYLNSGVSLRRRCDWALQISSQSASGSSPEAVHTKT